MTKLGVEFNHLTQASTGKWSCFLDRIWHSRMPLSSHLGSAACTAMRGIPCMPPLGCLPFVPDPNPYPNTEGNGRLDEEEFVALCGQYWGLSPRMARACFLAFDLDSSGFLNRTCRGSRRGGVAAIPIWSSALDIPCRHDPKPHHITNSHTKR
jgi:hypothetical protein